MGSSTLPCLGRALCRLRPSLLCPPSISRSSTSTLHISPGTMAIPHTSPLSTARSNMDSATPIETESAQIPATTPSVEKDAAIFDPHFLVVSLGNPPPHGEGLHSAGHHALLSLQKHLHRDHSQPQFSSERIAKKATQVSRGPKYTLFQCPTLMNVSGPWVAKAWKEVLTENSHTKTPMGLVVVHDDLEQDMCDVKTRNWDTSHRGHNGLKSIMAAMRPADYKDSRWAKIRIGIGRPEGRDHDTVSNYVLKSMSRHQKDLLSEKTGGPVLAVLKEIETSWKSEMVNGATQGPGMTTKQAKKAKH